MAETTEQKLQKLAEWLRGWEIHDRDGKLVKDANIALHAAIDQLFDPEENGDVLQVLGAAAPSLPSQWISVTERMPAEHGEYWVWLVPHPPQPSVLDSSRDVFVDFEPYARVVKTYQNGTVMRFNCGAAERPTHWMPYFKPAAPAALSSSKVSAAEGEKR